MPLATIEYNCQQLQYFSKTSRSAWSGWQSCEFYTVVK